MAMADAMMVPVILAFRGMVVHYAEAQAFRGAASMAATSMMIIWNLP